MTRSTQNRSVPPYQPGDYIQALHNSERHGTCLITADVTAVRPSGNREYPWTVTYTAEQADRSVNVDDRGRDRNDYTQRATHTLGPLMYSEAGRHAIELVHALRRRGVRRALATNPGDDRITVVVTRPTGERMTAELKESAGRLTFSIAGPDATAAGDRTSDADDVHGLEAAADTIARLYRRR
jgi:hypothetical protein